ncbi:unnamed protein product [Urochloa decumbens]|uniref:F-box domain-containing protein n=1 Tax=Urochloa decumbens TaxID=240449 RepID=A0ABC8WA69_9POAL
MSMPASLPVFPDEILEDIFLRLDAAADLARASAACTTFRRVVSGRRFRGRFRSLHPAPILGILEFNAFHPAKPPHRSAPAARALAQAADFSFSFLGAPKCWRVCDARDGRVLLYRRAGIPAAFPDLTVCDPLHRRYIQLPPIPDHLAAATGGSGFEEFDPFLDATTDKEKEEEDLSFRVICAVQCQHKLVTFHFSSVTGEWHGITFNRPTPLDPSMVKNCILFERHYVHSCFYWRYWGTGSLFILDTREMKFSVIDHDQLPSKYGCQQQAIVEVGEGRLGFVIARDGVLELYCKALGNKNNGVDAEWQHDKTIPLPQMGFCCYWSILAAAEGHILLQATPQDPSNIQSVTPESPCFTLDLKTFLVERLCVSSMHIRFAHLYASFPPSLSPPSI